MTSYAYDAEGTGHGQFVTNIVRPNIQPLSKVFASISEFNAKSRAPFIGDARMTIHNISPQAGSVKVWIDIEWGSDLIYIVNLLVVNL
jgi:hypothetical protein